MVKKEVMFVYPMIIGLFCKSQSPPKKRNADEDDEKQQEVDERASGVNSTGSKEASSPGPVPGENGDIK